MDIGISEKSSVVKPEPRPHSGPAPFRVPFLEHRVGALGTPANRFPYVESGQTCGIASAQDLIQKSEYVGR